METLTGGTLPPNAVEPNPKIRRKSRRRIWLRNLEPFVFNESYRPRSQRRLYGDFEIQFLHGAAVEHFYAAVRQAPPAPSSLEPGHTLTDESDDDAENGA